MTPYRNFRPTGCDPAGLGCADQQDWLVAPIQRTRDSGLLETANWDAFQVSLTDEASPEDYEVHRFGHWGPGWFEIVLIRPGSTAERVAIECESALADYPILDESLYSEQETAAVEAEWARMRLKDRVELCSRAGLNPMAARHADRVPDPVWERIRAEL